MGWSGWSGVHPSVETGLPELSPGRSSLPVSPAGARSTFTGSVMIAVQPVASM